MLMISVLFWGITQRLTASITDVSGQCIGPIFKGQDVQEEKYFLTLEDGTDMLSRNVSKGL
jgi:hypothetical protein